jgi:hypothetical protein
MMQTITVLLLAFNRENRVQGPTHTATQRLRVLQMLLLAVPSSTALRIVSTPPGVRAVPTPAVLRGGVGVQVQGSEGCMHTHTFSS